MGHTNSTPNLHLPQFIGSDKPTWLSDVNGAMLAIDTAYGTIEAEASSAATAAAGAVTVAGAAQTAADSAATAAATAGTNASQALSTANNAASVALQAQTDASEALDRVNGEVIASVTADGVKTITQILEELVSVANIAELSNGAYITIAGVSNWEIYRLYQKQSNLAYFSCVKVNGNGSVDVFGLRINHGSTSGVFRTQIATGGTTVDDQSATVETAGVVFKLYK